MRELKEELDRMARKLTYLELGQLRHDRQIHALRRQAHEHEEYIDTVSSPLWKRAVWWCQGFYFRKVGRWYGKQLNLNGVWPDNGNKTISKEHAE